MDMKSVLIKDTTREERKRIIQEALDCNDSAGCENCSGCGLFGAGDRFEMYEDYIEGKREIKEINMEFVSRYFVRGYIKRCHIIVCTKKTGIFLKSLFFYFMISL